MALTTAEHVASVLKTDATTPRFADAYQAAERWVAHRCTWKTVEQEDEDGNPIEVPVDVEDLVQAIVLLTGRYLARQNSPDGLVGMGDLGVMRVSAVDRDVQSLIAPYRKIVV